MRVVLSADQRMWLEVPHSFPTATDASAEAWEDRIIGGMREAWRGALTVEAEPVVREALRNGLRRVLPDDAITLQFWPGASLVNAIVHVSVSPFAEGEERSKVPLSGGPYVVDPVSQLFESEHLGVGVESRELQAFGEDPPVTLGTVSYLFTNSRGFVFVGCEPTFPAIVGGLIEPLREVVRSIRVLDDDGLGPWARSEATEADIPARGETWDSVVETVA